MQQAAAYYRYSDSNQRDESIEAQQKAVKKHAAEKGYTIVKEYTDKALTGKNDKRPGFQQMINDAKSGLFTTLLCHKVNRFGRNKNEITYYKYKLQKSGVKVILVAEDFGDGPHSVIMESLMEGMAEFFSLDLSTEVMKGLMVNADHCKYNGGIVLYGYGINKDKHYIINPEESAIVQEIFTSVISGKTYGDIIRTLNNRGVSRRGATWKKPSIYEMLKNERYVGTYTFNISSKKLSRRDTNPESEIVRIPGGMPQIVSQEQFSEVQGILSSRRHVPPPQGRAKHIYILSGLLVCADCGSPYVGSNKRVRGKDHPAYVCTGRKIGNGCRNPSVGKHLIEPRVIRDVREIAQSIDPDQFAAEYNRYADEYVAGAVYTIKDMEKEISALQKKADNLAEAIELGGNIPMLADRLREALKEKAYLTKNLHIVKGESSRHYITPTEVREIVKVITPQDSQSANELASCMTKILNHVIIKNGQVSQILTRLDCCGYGVEPARRYLFLSPTIESLRNAVLHHYMKGGFLHF